MTRTGFTPSVPAAMMANERVERKWRIRPPGAGVPGSLYDFVRRHLCAHGGICSRDQLQLAILAEPILKARLENGGGFRALLSNMRHSGDIAFAGEFVKATSRTIRRVNTYSRQDAL